MEDNESTEFQVLNDRWKGFLEKIKERHYAVLEEAKSPMSDVIAGLEYDTIVIHNILNGIRHQSVTLLYKKCEDSWVKMQAELEKINTSYDTIFRIRKNHDNMREWMQENFERYSIKTFADAARQIEKNVRKHIDENKINNCIKCGDQLPIKIYSFMAINLKCPSCGAVNTYEPDGHVRSMEYYVIGHLAEEHAMEEKIKGEKDKKFMADYYKKYYGFIMEQIPDKKEYTERILNDKLSNPDFVGK